MKTTNQVTISTIAAMVSISLLSACNTKSSETTGIQPAPAQQELENDSIGYQKHSVASDSAVLPAVSPRGDALLPPMPVSHEKYALFDDNKTTQTLEQPVSTFSIDVDTGAYANIRRFLNHGQLPPADAVRVEEMLNYFNYDYPADTSSEQPFSIITETGPTPWNENTRLLHIGLQGQIPKGVQDQAANLVFLIDVSGSMNSPDKLGLLKSAMSLMARQLDESDTVSVVVYAGSSGVALEPTPGNEHRQIERSLSNLQSGGGTNGAEGIELAYELAMDNFIADGTNRVILATDGDFNIGTSDTPALIKLIEDNREQGVALTTLGFGMGNYNDHLMEQLADAGNGNYAYIDTLGEARKVLVEELTATLVTIAKDVKIQIEFNPATVSEYRLIGYTNRILANEDFSDDRIDAGEIGAGHSVTALYEIALINEGGERHSPRRYGADSARYDDSKKNEIAELRLRYKQPDSDNSQMVSQLIEKPATLASMDATSNAFQFAASVAGFGQLLRGDTKINDFSYTQARELASNAREEDQFGYRAEYLRLLDLAESLENLKRAAKDSDEDSKG